MNNDKTYYEDPDEEIYEEDEEYPTRKGIRPVAAPPPSMSERSNEYLYLRENGLSKMPKQPYSDTDEEDVPRKSSKIAQRISNTKLVQDSYKLYEKSLKTKIIIFVSLVAFALLFVIGAYFLLSK